MKKSVTITLFVTGLLFILYTAFLHVKSPGTPLDILISFRNFWAVVGLCLVGVGIFRVKKGRSLWSAITKKIRAIIISVVAAGALIACLNLFFILRAFDSPLPPQIDYIIVLGGGIDKNGKLPYSVETRVNKGVELMNIYEEAQAVVTGGTLYFLPFPEAPAIKAMMTENGISPDRIFVEDQALDTIQNFQKSAELLSYTQEVSINEIKNARVLVVTNYFHLARALRIARRLGFTNVYGAGSHIKWYDAPMAYVREICAYIKLNARILLTGKPSQG